MFLINKLIPFFKVFMEIPLVLFLMKVLEWFSTRRIVILFVEFNKWFSRFKYIVGILAFYCLIVYAIFIVPEFLYVNDPKGIFGDIYIYLPNFFSCLGLNRSNGLIFLFALINFIFSVFLYFYRFVAFKIWYHLLGLVVLKIIINIMWGTPVLLVILGVVTLERSLTTMEKINIFQKVADDHPKLIKVGFEKIFADIEDVNNPSDIYNIILEHFKKHTLDIEDIANRKKTYLIWGIITIVFLIFVLCNTPGCCIDDDDEFSLPGDDEFISNSSESFSDFSSESSSSVDLEDIPYNIWTPRGGNGSIV